MAGDWIKMRTSLMTNPKVNGIAKALECNRAVTKVLSTGFSGGMCEIVTRNVMRYVTVASLIVTWGAANEHTRNGVFTNSDLSDIDDMTGIPGFGEAMASVGWAVYDPETNSVTLPNFSEYNTSGSERSASAKSGAKRQKEYRERLSLRHCDVTSDVTSDRREEKSREEKEKDYSEAKASGAESAKPQRVTDPDEIIFGYGVPLLVSAGSEEKHARSFLGKLRKDHGDTRVVDALRDCVKAKPLQPLEWLAGALPPKGKSSMNRQEAIEADGKRVAAEWLAEQRGCA